MQEIFEKRQNVDYNLRFKTDFVLPGVDTTYFGLHSLRYLSFENLEIKIKMGQW